MNPNESAFPNPSDDPDCLTVRAYIATKAMAAIIMNSEYEFTKDRIAKESIECADALIAELSKTP